MAQEIKMPQLGMDMSEGTFISWTKQVGDSINVGDVIAEIETDKTTVEVESPVSGTIISLLAQPGEVVKVGALIGWVGEAGETAPSGGAPVSAPAPTPAAATSGPAPAPIAAPAPVVSFTNGEEYPAGVKASPVARKVAQERGIDLKAVPGTGPGGRIVKSDVENFTPLAAPVIPVFEEGVRALTTPAFYADLPSGPDVEVIDITNLRKRIASRMTESKQHVPHFYVTTEIDVEALLNLRKQLNANVADEAQKISVNDLVVKATALALRHYPNLNSHFYGDKIVRHKRINIGIAVALPNGGLMNVVAKDADKTALGVLAEHNKTMIARARDGKVKPDDVQGSTFTVSNLGIYDVEHFIAIVNPPEAGILAVGSAKKTPVVLADGSLGVGTRMKLTVSVDHRVSDGAEGAEFLQYIKGLLENPLRLVV